MLKTLRDWVSPERYTLPNPHDLPDPRPGMTPDELETLKHQHIAMLYQARRYESWHSRIMGYRWALIHVACLNLLILAITWFSSGVKGDPYSLMMATSVLLLSLFTKRLVR